MGTNTRVHACKKINKLLLLCLEPTFFNSKTELIFRKTAHPQALGKVKTDLEVVDWQTDTTTLLATLKDNHFDPHLLASVIKEYMQHGAILKQTFEVRLSWEVLVQQLRENTADLQQHFLQFIGQLVDDENMEAASVIHHFLHLGKIVATQQEKNKMNEDAVSQLFGAILLEALELDGHIFKKDDRDPFGTLSLAKEMKLFSQLVCGLLKTDFFAQPFNANKYSHYKQTKIHREILQEQIHQQLWKLPALDVSLSELTTNFSALSLGATSSSTSTLAIPQLSLESVSGYISGDESEAQPAIIRQFESAQKRKKKLEHRKSYEDKTSSKLSYEKKK